MANLIKNYLPLRLSLPSPGNPSASEDCFIFVKQHISSGSLPSLSKTLFIANAPFYPNVRSSIILQCLFERYGDVDKVSVAHHPRNGSEGADVVEDMADTVFKKEINSLGGGGGGGQSGITFNENSWYDQGKFAHVVFSSSKTMNKVWKLLNDKKKGKNNTDVIKFGKLEMQELEDVSFTLYQKERKQALNKLRDEVGDENDNDSDSDSDKDEENEPQQERKVGLSNLLQIKKDSIPSREYLKKVCDRIMSKYEEAEEDANQKQIAAKDQPDGDGFVTVSYSKKVGDIVDLEETESAGRRRKMVMKQRARSAKNNLAKGSDELPDFYRFQMKESKKRGMEELKSRFQEDLKRVKKMKEDKMYRPF